MDVALCAGDAARRRVDLSGVAEGTADVIPLEMYDSARAKIAANLQWLFAKAYGIGKYLYLHYCNINGKKKSQSVNCLTSLQIATRRLTSETH